jgi:hypothetical protein
MIPFSSLALRALCAVLVMSAAGAALGKWGSRTGPRVALQGVLTLAVLELLAVGNMWQVPEIPHVRSATVPVPTDPPVWVHPVSMPVDGLEGPRPDGERRVLFVGDSFTQAQGVQPPDTFPTLVGEALGVRAINTGQCGQSFLDEVVLYADSGWRTSPDAVVWVFVLNDLGLNLGQRSGKNDFIMDRSSDGAPLSFALHAAVEAVRSRGTTAATTQAYLDVAARTDALDAVEAALRPLVSEVEGRGGRFLFTIFPLMHELDAYPFQPVHDALAARAEAAGAEVLDLAPTFAGRDEAALWVHPMDHHPNEAAHALAAEAIVAALGTLPASAPVSCDDTPRLPGEAPERYTLRQAICERPADPEVWLQWAAWWADNDVRSELRPVQQRRFRRHGVGTAWLLTPEGEREALLPRIQAVVRSTR